MQDGEGILNKSVLLYLSYGILNTQRKNKEEPIMKTTTVSRPVYPNAADRRYYLRKLLDLLLMAATSIGTVAIILFFLLV